MTRRAPSATARARCTPGCRPRGQGEPFLPGPTLRRALPPARRRATRPATGASRNPTWERLEAALGELEGGEVVVFASGMAAVTAVLLTALGPGDVLVAPGDAYPGVRDVATRHLGRARRRGPARGQRRRGLPGGAARRDAGLGRDAVEPGAGRARPRGPGGRRARRRRARSRRTRRWPRPLRGPGAGAAPTSSVASGVEAPDRPQRPAARLRRGRRPGAGGRAARAGGR